MKVRSHRSVRDGRTVGYDDLRNKGKIFSIHFSITDTLRFGGKGTYGVSRNQIHRRCLGEHQSFLGHGVGEDFEF